MSAWLQLTRRWNAFWFAPASPYPVAAFRILVGVYLLGYLAVLLPHVPVLFSSQGVYVPYLVPDYGPPPLVAWLLFAALLLGSLLLLLGVRSGIVIPSVLVLYMYHYFLSLGVKHSSFERLLVVYLLALWPARADTVWSLWTAGRPAQPPAAVSCFATRLVRFQTIILYLGASLWKAANPAWHTGALLHATMQGIWATPLAFWIARHGFAPETWTLASYAVIVGEAAVGLLLWIPPTRPVGVALGVLFHVANSVILSIPEFLVCLCPYVFFMHEHTVERAGRALLALFRPRSRASA